MLLLYGKYWWSFLIRGIMATLFGVAAILLPGITLEVLVILLAVFLVVDGVLSFTASLKGRGARAPWKTLALEGLTGIVLGLIAFVWPGITILALIMIIGFWAMLTGVLEIIAAVRLRHEIPGEWFLGLSGVLSILFSVILLVNPGIGAVAVIWLIGAYAIFFGISLIFLGIRLRKHRVVLNL